MKKRRQYPSRLLLFLPSSSSSSSSLLPLLLQLVVVYGVLLLFIIPNNNNIANNDNNNDNNNNGNTTNRFFFAMAQKQSLTYLSRVVNCVRPNTFASPCQKTIFVGDNLAIWCPSDDDEATVTMAPTSLADRDNGGVCTEMVTPDLSTGKIKCEDGKVAKWDKMGMFVRRIKDDYLAIGLRERVADFVVARTIFIGCQRIPKDEKKKSETKTVYVQATLIPHGQPYYYGYTHTCGPLMSAPVCILAVSLGDSVDIDCVPFGKSIPETSLSQTGEYCAKSMKGKETCDKKEKWNGTGVEIRKLEGSNDDEAAKILWKEKKKEFAAYGLCKGQGADDKYVWGVMTSNKTRNKDLSKTPPEGAVKCKIDIDGVTTMKYTREKPCSVVAKKKGQYLEVDCTGLNILYPRDIHSLCTRPFRSDDDKCEDASEDIHFDIGSESRDKLRIDFVAGYIKQKDIGDVIESVRDPIRRYSSSETKLGKNQGPYYGRCHNDKTKQSIYFKYQQGSGGSSLLQPQLFVTILLSIAAVFVAAETMKGGEGGV